jgi:hypothetical protein
LREYGFLVRGFPEGFGEAIRLVEMPHLYVIDGEQEPRRSIAADSILERFKLVTSDGSSLGEVGLARLDWPLGVIIDRDGRKLRVVEINQPDAPREPRILVVEPL